MRHGASKLSATAMEQLQRLKLRGWVGRKGAAQHREAPAELLDVGSQRVRPVQRRGTLIPLHLLTTAGTTRLIMREAFIRGNMTSKGTAEPGLRSGLWLGLESWAWVRVRSRGWWGWRRQRLRLAHAHLVLLPGGNVAGVRIGQARDDDLDISTPCRRHLHRAACLRYRWQVSSKPDKDRDVRLLLANLAGTTAAYGR